VSSSEDGVNDPRSFWRIRNKSKGTADGKIPNDWIRSETLPSGLERDLGDGEVRVAPPARCAVLGDNLTLQYPRREASERPQTQQSGRAK
jgi:hypothetical protein